MKDTDDIEVFISWGEVSVESNDIKEPGPNLSAATLLL